MQGSHVGSSDWLIVANTADESRTGRGAQHALPSSGPLSGREAYPARRGPPRGGRREQEESAEAFGLDCSATGFDFSSRQ